MAMDYRVKLAAAIAVLFLFACSGENPTSSEAESATPPAAAPTEPTGIAGLGADWTAIEGGEGTTCSDGSPYRFYVRNGASDKLMFYMQGGGGCWFRQNCDPEMQPSYTINIPPDFNPGSTGVFNFDKVLVGIIYG